MAAILAPYGEIVLRSITTLVEVRTATSFQGTSAANFAACVRRISRHSTHMPGAENYEVIKALLLDCAVRRESGPAVMHLWGIGQCKLWTFRQALGIDGNQTEGLIRLRAPLSGTLPKGEVHGLLPSARAAKAIWKLRGRKPFFSTKPNPDAELVPLASERPVALPNV